MPKRVNHGKDFENQIREAFKRVPDTFVCRLKDSQSMYKGDDNPCDFIFYKKPNIYLIECKTTYEHTLNWSNIRDNQWNSLLSLCDIPGVVAGYMIWFISDDKTVYVSASELLRHREDGFKSFNINKDDDIDYILIDGKKRRVLFDYDVSNFLTIMED
jgi:recombination protein U